MELSDKLHIKLKECISLFLIDSLSDTNMPFYGHFNLLLNFYESISVSTCGVNITPSGMNFFYNKDFLDNLSQKEVNFINIHEIFHLLFDHPNRITLGGYDAKISNVVQDMIINYIIWKDIPHKLVEIPKSHTPEDMGRNIGLFIPKDYNGPLVFEHLYDWFVNKMDEYKSDSSIFDDMMDYGEYGKDNIECYSIKRIIDHLDENNGMYLDIHMDDDIPNEVREGLLENALNGLRSQGILKSINEDTILKLVKKRKDYLREIKKTLSNDIFGSVKTKTITKPNRRGIDGLKGKRKIKYTINCILDISGSMDKLTDKVMNYIYRNDISVNLIQVDTEVRKVEHINTKKQIDKIKVKKGGGTILQPGINYISKNLNSFNNVILTDGECDILDLTNILGSVLIISAKNKCRTKGKKCKQIIVDND